MRAHRLFIMTIAAAFALQRIALSADTDPRLQELQGSWRLESLEQAGEKVDEKKLAGRVMFIGSRSAFVRQGGAVIQVALVNPVASGDKKYLNISVLQGQDAGAVQLGIYQVKGDSLKICYDGGGIDRPTEFKTLVGTKQVLAVYKKRTIQGTDRQDLSGYYKSVSQDDAGKTAEGEAIIEKQGDSYSVIYKHGGGVAFVGIGIREGDTLSVSWRNQLQTGISVYKVGDDGKLNGKYTVLGSNGAIHSEVLHPEEA